MNLLEMLIERDDQGSMSNQLRQTWCQQAGEMAQCLYIHRQTFGLKQIPSQVVDAIQNTLGMLVYRLDSNEARHAFTELCRFGMTLSHKLKPTAETIYKIQSLYHRGTVKIPFEAVEILGGSKLRRGEGP